MPLESQVCSQVEGDIVDGEVLRAGLAVHDRVEAACCTVGNAQASHVTFRQIGKVEFEARLVSRERVNNKIIVLVFLTFGETFVGSSVKLKVEQLSNSSVMLENHKEGKKLKLPGNLETEPSAEAPGGMRLKGRCKDRAGVLADHPAQGRGSQCHPRHGRASPDPGWPLPPPLPLAELC